jgi:hypothetical protein
VAYKGGSVFAGGILLWVRDIASWEVMFGAFGCLYLLAVILVKRLKLVGGHHHMDSKAALEAFSWSSVLNVPGTLSLLAFVTFYKLCERAEQVLCWSWYTSCNKVKDL